MGGIGTNTDFYGVIELFGADFFSGATANVFSNSVSIGGDLAIQGYGDVGATLTDIYARAITNNWNSWVIYGSPTVSNSMFAVNRGLGIVTNSTSFSGLVQSIVNRGAEGFHIEIMPNPYYSNSYSADATITITNWGIIQGHGNPVTVIRGTAALNGPIFQVGTTSIGSGGINRFKDLRLEGDNMGANGVGVKIVNSAEPTFRDMEVTGFKKAGIELASTNNIFWAYADHVWFVMKNAGAVGLLVSGSSIATDRAANHFDVNDCNFGVGGGGEPISITANFPNIRVTDSIFKYQSGTMNYGISQLNGRDAYYSGNKFVNFSAGAVITFAASGGLYTGVTNLNPTFVNNHSDGTAEIIALGQFVTNVTMSGNSIRGSGPTVLYEDVASNGRINNLDPTELRLGHLTTNTIPYIGAYGEVKTATLSGLTLSGGTLTATGSGTPGGSTTQIQYNNAGAFGGSSLFTYEEASSTGAATVRGTSSGAPSLRVAFDNGTVKITNMMFATGLQLYSNQNDPSLGLSVGYFGTGFSTVSFYTNRFLPLVTNHYDAGTFLLPFRTNYANDFVAKNSVSASSFIGSGTGSPQLQLLATNNNAVVMGIAISNSVMITNLVGILHKAYASVVVLDCNHGNRFAFTNRAVTANTTLVLTNLAQGQEINITMLGESAANDRTVTVVPQLGYLVSDLDAFGVAVALNKSFTLTNNNGVEISALATYEIGTNWCNVVTRQYKR
jgi:hypothetical protein